RIAQWAPDIAVIQECEHPERLVFEPGVPGPTSQLWFGDPTHPSKGLAVFSYTGYRFACHRPRDDSIRYCLPLRVTGDIGFNLIAIWAMGHTNRQPALE